MASRTWRPEGAQVRRFLAGADAQARDEGARFARERRVGEPSGGDSVTALVRGETGTYQVTFWPEAGQLAAACECPSFRDPCKHQVAAALVIFGTAAAATKRPPARTRAAATSSPPETIDAAARALAERREAAARERMRLALGEPPFVLVASASGFTYRVHVRGDAASGPHSCECPDFEANRLHACKHAERVRLAIGSGALPWPEPHARAASRPRAYLHFGEAIEPRWLGESAPRSLGESEPRSLGEPEPRRLRDVAAPGLFDALGRWLGPVGDLRAVRDAMSRLGAGAEPEALLWLDERLERIPDLGDADPAALIPATPAPLHAYQRAGIAFLARAGRALLADEMGLGKTVQAILAAAVLRHARRPVRAVTVACPASLRSGWQDEIRRWLGEDAVLLSGPAEARRAVIASRPAFLVTHYEQILRDREAHAAQPPDLLIVDEAQRAKGLHAATARALKSIGARHVFALTGTPLENRLEDAYAIAQLIDQRLLPPLWQLERDHEVREEGARVVAYRGLDALRTRLAPAFLRRRKEDVALDLPERVRSVMRVPMHPGCVEAYESALASVRRIASRKRLTPDDVQRIQRLLVVARRACDAPQLVSGGAPAGSAVPKLAELEHLLRDVAFGERRKVLVFSEWSGMTALAEQVSRSLALPTFHLRGEIAVAARPQLLRAFTGAEGPAVLVSTDAGGVGLNLQAADVVVNLDLPWNPARLEQRLARAHRIGSRRTVHEILLVTQGTLEERMLLVHASKREVLDSVWSGDGEDVVLAPGAAGAFAEVVARLVADAEAEPRAAEPSRGAVPRFDAPALAARVAGSARLLSARDPVEAAAALRRLADELEASEPARQPRAGPLRSP